ncbi:MAG: SPOR domain-containing protein [Xenococcus sp. MO_188.B8]|nr:SPOR domain-containing protein [Xenococcus sp. MO_188.B8]
MTIKAFFLNRLSNFSSGSLWVLIFYSLGNTLLINGCLANSLIAQNEASAPNNILPPPPPLSPPNIIIKTQESPATPNNIEPLRSMVQNAQEEYIFNAPRSTQSNYKVEVFGNSNLLLKQVREVEPKAFIKGNIIQVGIFSEEANALDLVQQLTLRGLWARIVVES